MNRHEQITSVDTTSEALTVSMNEKACIDLSYMAKLNRRPISFLRTKELCSYVI